MKLLFLMGLLLVPASANPNPVVVGGASIEIPTPAGFARVTPEMTKVYELQKLFVPPTNEQLAFFISQSDVPEALAGDLPDLSRRFSVQIAKQAKNHALTEPEFSQLKESYKADDEARMAEMKNKISGLMAEVSKGASQQLDLDLAIKVQGIVPLPSHHESDRTFSTSMFMKNDTKVASDTPVSEVVSATMTMVRVKDRLLFLYSYGSKDDLKWTREKSQEWADAIVAANTMIVSSASRALRHPETHSASAKTGSDWLTYRTDGHAKSNGINLTIKYPNDWSAQEGARPHVVQKFTQPDGKAYAMILIQDLGIPAGTPISQEELDGFFTPSELRGMVPDGMQFINAQKTAMEGLPAGILEYRATMQRAGQSFELQVWSLNFIYNKSLVQLQFAVGGVTGNINTAAQMQAQKPLFLQMANTVVLPDKWTAATSDSALATTTANAVSEASLIPGFDGSNLGANLLIALLLTWGIGLTPPLLIRFVLTRRPIGNTAAIGLTALFWVFNLVLFTVLGSQSKSHAALVLVALASYAILRKGAAQRVSA